ncbi:uncharacterized protein EMH_0034420 [Eimeria mitis]|uniref:Uncharacterized protein n=1 Tax=Eimeria mitis TaxID=44415 RepID=U6JW49_9EIME|nr:uncharacterized protein EMH_0034420 [Eimeria mitis]CDJ27743.1 hypothetical protein, conserved [Eimeria mitis]
MSETRAVEFLQQRSGDDMFNAVRMQHSVICELQSENARLKSEKMEQKRHFKAAIQHRDSVIKRLGTANSTSPAHPITATTARGSNLPSASQQRAVLPAAPPPRAIAPGTPPTRPRRNDTTASSNRELRQAGQRRRRGTDTLAAPPRTGTAIAGSRPPATPDRSQHGSRAPAIAHSSSRRPARQSSDSSGAVTASSSAAYPKASRLLSGCCAATCSSTGGSSRTTVRVPERAAKPAAKSRRGAQLTDRRGETHDHHTSWHRAANARYEAQNMREYEFYRISMDAGFTDRGCASQSASPGVSLGPVIGLLLVAAIFWAVLLRG